MGELGAGEGQAGVVPGPAPDGSTGTQHPH